MKEETKEFKKYYKILLIIICLILILDIVFKVNSGVILKRDTVIYDFISKYLISENLTPIIKVITNLGSAIFLISLSLLLLIFIKNKKMGGLICLNLALSASNNFILKQIIQRPRPVGYRLIEESGFSFPSGHSMVSASFYGFIIYLIFKNVKNKYVKWSSIISLIILIFLIGFSRIYLGVHYPSDVMGGYFTSIIYLTIYTSIINLYNKK